MTQEHSAVASNSGEPDARKIGAVKPGRGRAPGPGVVFLARAALAIERFAPLFVIGFAPIFAIMLIGLFEGWDAAPRVAHAIAILAAIALSASLFWRRRRPDLIPTRTEALARLERDGRVRHDALRVQEDAAFSGGGPLWDAHVAEMERLARAARLASPRATANAVDPNGLRYAALALFLCGVINAGADTPRRLIAAFMPADPRAGTAGFADLWIEPPAYTGKAPIYLLRGADTLGGTRDKVAAPQGSIVYAQAPEKSGARLTLRTAGRTVEGAPEGSEKSGRLTLVLTKSGAVTLKAGGRAGRWPIDVIADRAPIVDFSTPPQADSDGRLAFAFSVDDDYGAVLVALRLRLDPAQPRPLDAPAFDAAATKESRIVPVDGAAGPPGVRAVALDLNAEPWAGLSVIASLIVTDAAGNSAETAPVTFTLPAKSFFNPLARAVIEQRQTLAVAPGEWRRAEWAFGGLTLGPEHFYDGASDYLLLRSAMWRVSKEAGGDYKDTVEEFWPLALQLEDESLELARRRLEAARDALREALHAGGDDSEIERLTEEMRAALQHYLQALAQSGGAEAQSGPPADETVTAADLEQMLDQIRDLSRSGAKGAAQQALADLESLLDNLRRSGQGRQAGQNGQPGGGRGGEGDQGGGAGEAGDLIGRQRELADRAFERSEKRGAAGDDLGDDQGAIARDLSELMKELESAREGAGASEGGEDNGSARAFGRALGAMRRSEEALKAEEFSSAAEAMERAIESLREGAEGLARAQAAARSAGGQGQGASPMRDPLGRPTGNAYGRGAEVPEQSDAQRARELLEELRRRLSDGERSEEEIDYLERLLERF